MSEILLFVLFLVTGYFTGILVGMMGIGGGLVFVPLLFIMLPYSGVDPNQLTYLVLGTSLFTGTIASISSSINHIKNNNMELRKSLILAFGSVSSAFLTPFFVIKIDQHTLKIIFAIIFFLIALRMLLDKGTGTVSFIKKAFPEMTLFLFGFFIGIVAGFAGIGGGLLYVPVLMYFFKLDMKKSIGTSSLVTAFTMFSSAVGYAIQQPSGYTIPYQIGYIYLLAGIPLGIGAAFGAYLGVKFVFRYSNILLKRIFSIVLIIAVIKIIFEL